MVFIAFANCSEIHIKIAEEAIYLLYESRIPNIKGFIAYIMDFKTIFSDFVLFLKH